MTHTPNKHLISSSHHSVESIIKITCVDWKKSKQIAKQLKKDTRSSSPPTGVLRFIIRMSSEEEHSHSTATTKISSIIHPRLQAEIYKYVENNMCSTKTMKIHLEEFVQCMFEDGDRPKPDRLNRGFYPTDKSIRFHMQQALNKVKQSKYDQDALVSCITTWQTESTDEMFSFRPYGGQNNNDVDEESYCSTFLFCHQSKWQQDLLARYGNHISVLDAAYKTVKYDIPLFFIIVKTNSGYCIVGTFVVQSESKILIAEALSQFKIWNPDWDPKYFLTDNSETGINAIQETFPDSTVYLCAFHREQSWNRWLTKTESISRRAIVPLKQLWQDIAASSTEQEYVENLNKMYNNNLYKEFPNAQRYFTEEWLPVNYRWVSAYHNKNFLSLVNINNGVEGQDKFLNHAYLKKTKYSSVTHLIKTIIKFLLPEVLQNYRTFNTVVDSEYYETLPAFLNNRPMSFINHVMERLERAKEYDSSHVYDMGEGLFFVKSEVTSDDWVKVNFQEGTCNCSDFYKWHFPCIHMCTVFLYTDWVFDNLPLAYREDPFIMVDLNCTAVIGEASNYFVQSYSLEEYNDAHITANVAHVDDSKPQCVDLSHIAVSPLPTPCTAIDEKKGRLELQRNFMTMIGHASLHFTPENLKKAIELSHQWTKTMRSLVTKSKEGFLLVPFEENASGCTKSQTISNKKQMYTNLPKCTKPKTRLKSSIK